jgi:hypothetical protein
VSKILDCQSEKDNVSLSYSLNRSSISGGRLFKRAHREPLSSESRLMWSPFLKRNAIQVTIFFAAYYIAGVLGQATTNVRSSNIGPVWPAYGVALAAFLVCGYRVWPAIALGAFRSCTLQPHYSPGGSRPSCWGHARRVQRSISSVPHFGI